MKNRSAILRISAFVIVAAVIVYLFAQLSQSGEYRYEVGKAWRYTTLVAPRDFAIYKSAEQIEQEKQERLADFTPYFTYTRGKKADLIVSSQDMNWLKKGQYKQIFVFSNKPNGDKYDISKVHEVGSHYNLHALSPTITLDSVYTDSVMKVRSRISPTADIVSKGDTIVRRGEVVTEMTFQKLQSLEKALNGKQLNNNQQLWKIVGQGLLVVLFLTMFVIYLIVFRREYIRRIATVLFFCLQILIIITLAYIAARFGNPIYIYIIPFAWVAILTRVFLDSRTALFIHITTVLITSVIVPIPEEFLFVQIVAGMVAVSSLSDMTRRAQLVQTAGWILLAQSLSYSALSLAQTGDLTSLKWHVYAAFTISAILTIGSYGLIYLFEKIFHFISSITLVELTDINSDLLHSLAEKAPGTFQHSMQVSNLASEAAKAIGANALLVRTGALYHDIGKTANPLYFVENQSDSDNPLIKMDPREAAKVVIAHVSEGEKLARKSHLPEAVINFITTHHGTSLVRYFYNTYCNAHPGEKVDESLFRYPGEKPSTKEAAILMMADAIEARSRSLTDFSEASITKAVNQMIDSQIADGQFADTPLSFKDVETIRRVFVNRLSAMNHHRISYPTLNNGK